MASPHKPDTEEFRLPRILIAGTHSGCGKTTVAQALMAVLAKRGMKVQPFKVGPDFIDPSHHSRICGRVSRNLDVMMAGEEDLLHTFQNASQGADIAIIEGVMGMFDGVDGTGYGSSADISRILQTPVLLVIDVKGMSSSVHAITSGFARYDQNVRFSGTILNRVGSDRHCDMLREQAQYPQAGFIRKHQELTIDSRHLGLLMAGEITHSDERFKGIEDDLDIDMILQIASNAPPLQIPVFRRKDEPKTGIKFGVARDPAFCFYYQENFERLVKAGAELLFFSPMTEPVPEVDALYLGGGYPELYAEALEKSNTTLQIASLAKDGMPVYAECGGLIYLTRGITTDRTYRWAGVLPADAIMEKRFQALGYSIGMSTGGTSLIPQGQAIRGHEFHYSSVIPDNDAAFCIRLSRGKGITDGKDGMYSGESLGSYTHAWFTDNIAANLVNAARKYQKK